MIDYIRKVSAGIGGEALLIIGSEKTAVYDTGMAYCGSGLVENVKKELKGGSPDYVLLSHTHYDHLGGMPYLRHEWPGIRVFGAAHGKDILQRPGALKAIRSLALGWVVYCDICIIRIHHKHRFCLRNHHMDGACFHLIQHPVHHFRCRISLPGLSAFSRNIQLVVTAQLNQKV